MHKFLICNIQKIQNEMKFSDLCKQNIIYSYMLCSIKSGFCFILFIIINYQYQYQLMNASLTIEKFTLYKLQPTCLFSIYKLYLVNFCVAYLSSLNGPRDDSMPYYFVYIVRN